MALLYSSIAEKFLSVGLKAISQTVKRTAGNKINRFMNGIY
jgi:hypothetical protein